MTDSQKPQQLSLEVSLRDEATFANFYHNDSIAIKALKQFSANQGEQNIIVWGGHHCGLTHLLQACNYLANLSANRIQYIPLADLSSYSPESVLDGLELMDLVCLDDIDSICGNEHWEQSVFHFYNRLRDSGGRLLIASHEAPASLPLILPDLKSRVCGSVTYHIHALNDHDKAKAIQMRARLRGMTMSDDVAGFILSRASRDTGKLFELLNRLDKSSLQQKRKLTIPFVKSVLTI